MHRIVFLILSAVLSLGQATPPANPSPLDRAILAYKQGQLAEAIAILDKQIPLEPDRIDYYCLRGDIYSTQSDSAKAIENYSEVVKLRPDNGAGYYRRATEYFRAGRVQESVADFDKLAELYPDRAPNLWQRGIAAYYAGQFEKGRKQFESHQTVNPADVENAVWHFLCVTKLEGFAKAREQLIPIQGDDRVPMQQIYDLFAGKSSPEDVLAAAKAGDPSPAQLKDRLFYAHLYLGLYEEAKGNADASLDHMRKAAGEFSQKHSMGDVARTHLKLRTHS